MKISSLQLGGSKFVAIPKNYSAENRPTVSIRKNGTISINRCGAHLLEEVAYVYIMVDSLNNRIALVPTDDIEGGYKLMSSSSGSRYLNASTVVKSFSRLVSSGIYNLQEIPYSLSDTGKIYIIDCSASTNAAGHKPNDNARMGNKIVESINDSGHSKYSLVEVETPRDLTSKLLKQYSTGE